jgi:ribonuclease P protein component
MHRLKRRQDFVAAAKGAYAALPGLVLQLRRRGDSDAPRVGFTATKKLGNAVVRNRVKRRLRAVAREALAPRAEAGNDYVLVGRAGTAARPYADLLNDLSAALKRLHRAPSPGPDKDTP